MKPRLLLWHWGRRGAGPQMLIALARALAPRAEVAISVSAQSALIEPTRALGLPLDAVPTYRSAPGFAAGLARVPALRPRLVRQAQAHRADAVISVMTHLWTPLVAPALPAAGIPFIPIIHDARPHPGDPAAFWGWRMRRELLAARLAVTLSAAVERVVNEIVPALPTMRMPLAAHLDLPPPRTGTRRDGPLRLLMFGRMRAYKGLDLLRDAFAMLPAGFTLRVVGDGPIDTLAPGLAALPGVTIERRWVEEAEIPALIAEADALVMPYREASQSGIIPIAQALGVPVVATPAGGLTEQVAHGIDGLLATDISVPALAAAIAMLAQPGCLELLTNGTRIRGAAMADWSDQAETLLRAIGRN